MADTKISALTALTGANVDTAADVLAIVDTSVTTTKKILIDELGIALQPFIDSDPLIRGSADATKLVRFEVDGSTTGTTRVLTTPDQNCRLGIVLGTPVASTSGTSIDYTGIPAGVKRITIHFVGVSTNGGSSLLVQIGDSGGIETSGYLGTVETNAAGEVTSTAGFTLERTSTTTTDTVRHGMLILSLQDSSTFTWCGSLNIGWSNTGIASQGGYSKSLSAELDRVRITTVNGSDTFDAGAVNISYE